MSTPWHTGRMAAFDTETTGVNTDTDRIVTAAVIHLGGGRPVDRPFGEQPLLLDPGVDIPEQATRVHGITTEHARAHGRPAADGVRALVAELANAAASGLPIVAMNASYDLTLLDREARRHGIQPLTDRGHAVHVLDPFVIDKWVDQYRKGKRRLDALCEHYDVQLDDAHNADADALAAARVLYRLGQRSQMTPTALEAAGYTARAIARWQALGAMSVVELHSAQIGWRADQAASLETYLRRTDPTATVDREWPVVPVRQEAVDGDQ